MASPDVRVLARALRAMLGQQRQVQHAQLVLLPVDVESADRAPIQQHHRMRLGAVPCGALQGVGMRTAPMTAVVLAAFAANSWLCRQALGAGP